MRKKRLLIVFLVMVLALTCLACGKKDKDTDKDKDSSVSVQVDDKNDKEDSKKENNEEDEETGEEGHVHKYDKKVVEVSCTKDGYVLYKCDCGASYKAHETKAYGHTYGAWKTVKKATMKTAGKEERMCTICKHKETQALPKLLDYSGKEVKLHQLQPMAYNDGDYSPQQQMSYVIETGNGSLIVIDGGVKGDADYLLEYLKKIGGNSPKIAAWFISHAHDDHYGALKELLETNRAPKIEKLILKFFNDSPTVEGELLDLFKKHNLPLYEPKVGEEIKIDNVVFKNIWQVGDHITYNRANNSSLVWRMEACGQSVLFLGDLGVEGGNDVMEKVDASLIRADIVQMAHHGQHGVTKQFYTIVSPKACLWPTPHWLWDNDFGEGFNTQIFITVETRQWMQDLNVKHHIVAKDGTQVLTLPVDFDASWGLADSLK